MNTPIRYFAGAIISVFLATNSDAADVALMEGFDGDPDVITIVGEIVAGDDTKFYNIAQQSNRAVVYLESPGGIVDTGLSISAEIQINGFTTAVMDGYGCHSICAIMWVSGVRRYMSPAAQISVHAAYRSSPNSVGSTGADESGIANAKIGAFLNEIGMTYDAISYFTVARPGEPLLPITPDIARYLDIDVIIQNGNTFVDPTDRPSPRSIAKRATDYISLSNYCRDILGANIDLWAHEAESALKRGHAEFGGEIFARLLPESIDVVKSSINEIGPARWCIGAAISLERSGLPSYVDGPSFNCNQAGTPTERAICGSRELWMYDRAVSGIYGFMKDNLNPKVGGELTSQQRSWLERRNDCGSNQICLVERYNSRLFDFGF